MVAYSTAYFLSSPASEFACQLGDQAMEAIVKSVFTAPLATLSIVAGMLFLLIAVIGSISGKIEPGQKARIASGVVGFMFISPGLGMHWLEKTPGISESPVISTLQPKTDRGETPIWQTQEIRHDRSLGAAGRRHRSHIGGKPSTRPERQRKNCGGW